MIIVITLVELGVVVVLVEVVVVLVVVVVTIIRFGAHCNKHSPKQCLKLFSFHHRPTFGWR